MKKEEKIEAIRRLKSGASDPKHRLIEIAGELENIGAHAQARRLWGIVCDIEDWQHRR